MRAIDNLVASGLALTVDLIVMTATLDGLASAVADLHERGVRAFNLWLVSLTDGNTDNVESLPRITDALPAMLACLDYGREHDFVVESLHVPRCLLRGYESHVKHPGVGMDVRVVTPDSVFDLTASRLSGGVKPERCAECVHFDACPGLREDYVARWGDEELVPVRDA